MTPFNSYMIGAFDAQVFLTNQLDPWEEKYKLDSRIDEMFLEGSQLYGLKNIFYKIFSFIPSDHGHKSYSYNYEKSRLACL